LIYFCRSQPSRPVEIIGDLRVDGYRIDRGLRLYIATARRDARNDKAGMTREV